MSDNKIKLDGDSLSLDNFIKVVREGVVVYFSKESQKKMKESRQMLEDWVNDEKVVYGVTTGFGPFVSVLIPSKHQTDLQENLIRSHSANVGPLFSEEEVRAAMLLRLNVFAKGCSAIRIGTVNTLKEMLNKRIHPCVPQWGSVGASGDLTPSSHIALALMGEGEVIYKGKKVKTAFAFKKEGVIPVKFKAKEGLQKIVDEYNQKIEEIEKKKERELLD